MNPVLPPSAPSSPHRLDVPGSDPLALRLFPPLPREAEWSLGRVEEILSELGDPHRTFPALHVGGTNGKGTVAALLASALEAGGARVGVYTSPHLVSFAERYRVGGRAVSAEGLVEVADRLRAPLEAHGLTFFEAATVLAFEVFRRSEIDVAVVEVGLGGRLDATNVLRPRAAGVTNIALDHSEYLGSDRTSIAREKAGIAKPGVPFLTSESDARIVEVLRSEAEKRGALFRRLDPRREIRGTETGLRGTSFELDTRAWGPLPVRIPLVGRHQAVNGAFAVRLLELLPDGGLRPSRDQLLEGFRRVWWPGRFQVVEARGRTWILDVAHNPAGLESLLRTLEEIEPPGPRALLVGMLGAREWGRVLPPLFSAVHAAVLTHPPAAPLHRRWDPEEALGAVPEGARPSRLEVRPDFPEALEAAEAAAAPGGTVVVTGSHYTVGAALSRLGLRPFGGPG